MTMISANTMTAIMNLKTEGRVVQGRVDHDHVLQKSQGEVGGRDIALMGRDGTQAGLQGIDGESEGSLDPDPRSV